MCRLLRFLAIWANFVRRDRRDDDDDGGGDGGGGVDGAANDDALRSEMRTFYDYKLLECGYVSRTVQIG